MFTPGQRVKLIKALGPFLPGAQGTVAAVFGENIIVWIDTDHNGDSVAPPFPEPPVKGSDYYQ